MFVSFSERIVKGRAEKSWRLNKHMVRKENNNRKGKRQNKGRMKRKMHRKHPSSCIVVLWEW